MLLPELRERLGALKRFLPDSRPIALDLKSEGLNLEFTPADVGQVAGASPRLFSLLSGGGGPSWSGESVNLNSALNHSVVWACTHLIAETTAFLPATLMRRQGKFRDDAVDHPMYSVMKNAPNEETTAQTFIETLTTHAVLGGNGYAQIIRRSGGTRAALGLQQLLPGMVQVDRDLQKRLVYVVSEPRGPNHSYTVEFGKPHDIFHLGGLGWNGVTGFSVITMGRQSMGTAIATERNVARFWANGGRVPAVLKNPKHFRSDEDYEDFRNKSETVLREPHRLLVLQDGIEYEAIGLSMVDAQALETREYTISEMCRWFAISPHLVGDLSRATFSNIEQLWLEFKTLTLNRWVRRWEQRFWLDVLTPDEKSNSGLYLKMNVDAILRGDFKTRMEAYASALQNGEMNIDETRELEDRNPLPDGAGEDFHIQLNMQPVQSAGEPKQQGSSNLVKLTGRKKQ